jgi:hypothetical protein
MFCCVLRVLLLYMWIIDHAVTRTRNSQVSRSIKERCLTAEFLYGAELLLLVSFGGSMVSPIPAR